MGMISELVKRPGEIPRHVNVSNSLEALPKTGKWEERIVEDPVLDPHGLFRRRWYCSNCGRWNSHGAAEYCMRCGARMENGRDAE